jgi:hypothetical protein
MYLNLYVPILQQAGIAHFWRSHFGSRFSSSAQVGPISAAFVRSIERFAEQESVPLIRFKPGERKDDVAQRYLRDFHAEQGVVFIGKAREKTRVVRTEKRRNPKTGQIYRGSG